MNLSLELLKRRSLHRRPFALDPLDALQRYLVADLRIAVERRDDRLHLLTRDGDPCTLEYTDGYRISRTLHGVGHITTQHWQRLNLSLCRSYMSIDCQQAVPIVRGLISADHSRQQVLQDLTAFFNLSSAAKHSAA
ncbi:hypothetical protein [Pseudomonas vanderleydeniana]|uniref:Uncharacterized protein n=1 Tax=Pseudomonas vanderleydeniana TaxID=2745495 RepID=A0A9E6PK21_9PSED|nr:hypothetical protein [Pseudomonas vanderleydeniana]QXI27616.1 hypothetical protein HU752_027540 [Pseudomonas vanderleydeniana]